MTSEIETWRTLAQQLRVDSIRVATEAGSGHPTSSLSAADLMAVLVAKYLRYDFSHPDNPSNDHLIFSKGHASPLLYSVYRAVGAVTEQEFLTYRRLGSRLEGHPTPVLPWVDVATGSLGQGIGIGFGVALSAKRLEGRDYRVWVLLGDSETAEGSVWEAFDQASYEQLSNLIVVLDCNRLGQRGPTELGWNTAAYADRARAFGWRTLEIDGHDLASIDRAYQSASTDPGPTLIVARTVKGKGVSFLEDKPGKHGVALKPAEAIQAIAELGGRTDITIAVAPPPVDRAPAFPVRSAVSLPRYPLNSEMATRQAFGEALCELGATDGRIVVLDAEVGNSTFTELFGDRYPDRFVQVFIREQLMVAAAVGLQVRGWIPFAATFGAFLSRAYDFIRMAAVSKARINLAGSHAGVSIGEDGPSQMALEDIASIRAVTGSTVLYPCDANQTARLVAEMVDRDGINFIRTTREKTPVIYPESDRFVIGGSRVLRRTDSDQATIVAAGITVFEALKAHDRLAARGIPVRVIDAYSVKPIDHATLRAAAEAGAPLVTVEDHRPEGGLGDAVLDAFTNYGGVLPRVTKLAVRELPGSGTPEELRRGAGIDAEAIIAAVKELLGA